MGRVGQDRTEAIEGSPLDFKRASEEARTRSDDRASLAWGGHNSQ